MRTVLLATLISCSTFAETWKGRPVVYEETSIELGDVLRALADFGHVNVVLLVPANKRIEVAISGKPWDQAFDEIVVQEGLSSRREGDVLVVGTPELLKQRKGGRYTMKRVRLFASGARASDVSEAVARACNCKPGALEGGAPVTVTLRNAPADQIVALVKDASAATGGRPATRAPGCAAPQVAVEQLTASAVVVGTASPSAVIVDKAGNSFVVGLKDCVGDAKATVKRIVADEVSLSDGNDLIVGGGVLASDRSRTRPVQIDEAIALIDSFGVDTFRGHRKAIERKRALLVFLRDALQMEVIEEEVGRTADEQLWNVPSSLAAQVDAAIAAGATATGEKLKTAPDVPALRYAALYDVWSARELGADTTMDAALDAAIARFEEEVKGTLDIESLVQQKKISTLPRDAPPELQWLLVNTAKKPKFNKRVQALLKVYRGEG